MKHFSLFILLVLPAYFAPAQPLSNPSGYHVDAQYSSYSTAKGKGKGMVFIVVVQKPGSKVDFTVDSFFVNGKAMKFTLQRSSANISILANYLVSVPEPSLSQETNQVDIPKQIVDPIIDKHQFTPSWITIRVGKKSIRLPITNFKEIQQKQ